ncbi:MAG: hypothetical protein IPN34_05055 [Planctomycetes bacterium]|nr:hypothetical protein [Planctomycetota bacterium]
MHFLRRKPSAALALSTLLCSVALTQQPAPAPKPDEPPAPLPALDDKGAAERVSEFKRLYSKSADLGRRLEAVKKLSTHRSDRLAVELQKVVLADPNPIVRADAAKALGRQDGAKAKAGIAACLKGLQGEEQQVVLLALLDALLFEAYDPAHFDILAPLFDKDSTPPAVQQRIVRLFGKGKEKRAFRLFVDNLNEPIPENVDDGANPPASYWEMRWKKWDVWRLDVAKALKELTGVEFKEKKFYKEWAKGEGKTLGFKY